MENMLEIQRRLVSWVGKQDVVNNDDNIALQSGSSGGDFREALMRSFTLESFKFTPDPGGPGLETDLAITEVSLVDGNISLTWASQAGTSYAIEVSDSLASGSFQVIQSGLAAEATSTSAVAEPIVDGGSSRFYRVREE